ncbi:hypothetical protein [Marinobacterium aestuariivivens]|uniref:hypothetical protein n=1 Tax=Marinobacterium aestuariivivens TaxID=1698799 RepID=UPI0036D3B7D8
MRLPDSDKNRLRRTRGGSDPKLQAVSVGLVLCLLWLVYESLETLERGSIVGIDSAETLAADHPDPVPVPVSGGGDDPGVVPAEDPDQDRFNQLAETFASYTRPTAEGIDPVAELLDRGAEPALDALIYVRTSERLLYRISFYAGERLVDEFDHHQLTELGYSAQYRTYGLLIEKDNQQTLIRQRYGRGGAVRNDAMLGAGSAAATVPPAPQTAL